MGRSQDLKISGTRDVGNSGCRELGMSGTRDVGNSGCRELGMSGTRDVGVSTTDHSYSVTGDT